MTTATADATKVCTGCGQTLLLSEYSPSNLTHGRYLCRQCGNIERARRKAASGPHGACPICEVRRARFTVILEDGLPYRVCATCEREMAAGRA